MRGANVQLVCPVSGRPLLRRHRRDVAFPVAPTVRVGAAGIVADTTHVWGADGLEWVYPELTGVPILLAPERLHGEETIPGIDTSKPPYAEAYSEQVAYGDELSSTARAERSAAQLASLREVMALADVERAAWPEPVERWAAHGDAAGAVAAAFRHLAPVRGTVFLQLGGDGGHALTMLALGAHEAICISPVVEEMQLCVDVATAAGLGDRLTVAVGLAEELPLPSGSVERVFSPSSIHHTVTSRSFVEVHRVLAPAGRFASVDVYESALYRLGIRLFGKRERNVFCQPLDQERLEPISDFDDAALSWHGAVFRYPVTMLERVGRGPSNERISRLAHVEDRWLARFPRLRKLASLVVVTATRDGTASSM